MSVQRELDVDLLMELYILVDKASGIASREMLFDHYAKEGVARARVEHSLNTLRQLQMIEEFKSSPDKENLKLSSHGIEWFEQNFILEGRNPYEFSTPLFKRVILHGPGGLAKRRLAKTDGVNWQKWGAILTGIGVVVSLLIWKLN